MKQLKYTANLAKMKQFQSFQADNTQLHLVCLFVVSPPPPPMFVFSPTHLH